jgi:hypothetical protein
VQVIQLLGHENITVIRNLLERSVDKDVLLYVPRGCEALENNAVNLTLLRRWADNLTLHLGLVVEDRGTQVLAKAAGLLVLPSIKGAEKVNLHALDLRRRRGKGLPSRPTPSLLFRERAQDADEPMLRRLLGRGGALVLASTAFLMLAAGVILFVLPSATVTLQAVSQPVQASMQILGVAGLSEVNYGLGQVPARVVSVERETFDTIATTNRRDVPDGHAEGTVVFANKTSIPITVTKGTVVRTSFGQNVRFFTVADAGVPGELYATARVGILAAEPGPGGNVPQLTINVVEGELAAQVDVLNDSRTSGGTVRRVSTVDGLDKVKLRAKLSKRMQEEAYDELTAALDRGDFIPPESLVINILDEEFDHKIDDITGELGLTMRVSVSGLAVSGADGEDLLLRLLEQRMNPGYYLLPDSASFERGEVIYATTEQALFGMSGQAAIAPMIEAQEVSSAIAGRSVESAKEYLRSRFALRSEPEIQLSGSLLQSLPWWAQRIRVLSTAG